MLSDDVLPSREVILAGFEGREVVRGGLVMRHDMLDRNVCRLMARHDSTPYWLLDDPAERARIAVALIRGYVVTHPTASPAEAAYDRRLRQLRRFSAARRALVTAAREARAFGKAAARASELFAHPVQNPVENHTGVIQPPTQRRRLHGMEHLLHHVERGDVTCDCNSNRVPT